MLSPAPDIRATVHDILRAELVRPAEDGLRAGESYVFRHGLILDSAYGSLTRHDRKRLHLLVANALEKLYPDRLDEYAARLAQHYAAAGDDLKTLSYATRAGDNAWRLSANTEAVDAYTLALAAARRADPAALPPATLLHLFTRRGRALELTSRYDAAEGNYLDMQEFGRARGDSALELAGLISRATLYSTFTPLYHPGRAAETAHHALELARQHGDRPAEARILWTLSLGATYGTGEMERAIQYGQEALAIARPLGLREQTAFILNDLFYAYLATRPLDEVARITEEALALWRELGNQPMLADALGNATLLAVSRGEFERACATAAQAFTIAEDIESWWAQSYAHMNDGHAYWYQGDVAGALHAFSECIRLGELGHFLPPAVASRSDLAWYYAQLGAFQTAIELGRAAVSAAEARLAFFGLWAASNLARCYLAAGDQDAAHATIHGPPFPLLSNRSGVEIPYTTTMRVLARVGDHLNLGHAALAEQEVQALRAFLETRGVRLFLPEVLALSATLETARGELDHARALLDQAIELAESLGARWDLWQLYARRAEVHTRLNNLAAYAADRSRAQQHLAFVLDHVPEESLASGLNLRATFRALPAVRALLDPA